MYKPNFCCDCGEKIESAKWKLWTTNRFCDECSTQLDNPLRRLLTPVLGAIVIAGSAFIAGQSVLEKPAPIVVSNNQTAPLAANATQTSQPQPARLNAASQTPTIQTPIETKPQTLATSASAPPPISVPPPTVEETVYYCGARTQKGTLCTRRKRGGGRCWQHEGKPALVAQEKLKISPEPQRK